MKKKSPQSLLVQLQKYLDEISLLGPDQLARVLILQNRAKRVVRRLRADFPDLKMTRLNPEKDYALRRKPFSPDSGAPSKPADPTPKI